MSDDDFVRVVIDGVPWKSIDNAMEIDNPGTFTIEIENVFVYVQRRVSGRWDLCGPSLVPVRDIGPFQERDAAMRKGNRLAAVQARNAIDKAIEDLTRARNTIDTLTVQANMLREADADA